MLPPLQKNMTIHLRLQWFLKNFLNCFITWFPLSFSLCRVFNFFYRTFDSISFPKKERKGSTMSNLLEQFVGRSLLQMVNWRLFILACLLKCSLY
jgi:hypothetical protein